MKIAIMHTMIAIYTWLPTYLMQSSMAPNSKVNAVLLKIDSGKHEVIVW